MITTATTFKKIDIHTHVVPGVDDGALDVYHAFELLKKAKEVGITDIVCTSHFWYRNDQYEDQLEALITASKRLKIRLYKGNEILLHAASVDDIINKRVYTINHSNYVLVEVKRNNTIPFVELCGYLEELLEHGFLVILAHPEQTNTTFKKKKELQKLRDMGIVFQIDSGSFYQNWKTRRRVKQLLKKNMVDIVASDVHRSVKTYEKYEEFSNYIWKKYGEEKAKLWFYTNPKKVLKNQKI